MSEVPQPVDYTRLRELVTAERLGSYLRASGNDLSRAFGLYEWNIEASGASVSLAAMVEVVVRNALDREMTAWATARGISDWLDAAPLDWRGHGDIAKARQRAGRGGRTVRHGHVVAELNLGFWRYLMSKRYLTSLWIPNLGNAFPHSAGDQRAKRQQLEGDVKQVLFLRNRAAHHEPIHRRDLSADLNRALRLVGAVDPVAERWLRDRELLSTIIAKRPPKPGP